MARQLQVAVDCVDPGELARFWCAVLGYVAGQPPPGHRSWADFSRVEGDSGEAWHAVVDPDGTGPRLLFHKVPERKVVKNRLHLDVLVAGAHGTPKDARRSLVDAEVARLLGEGATHVRTVEDPQDYFAVLQDPEGNEFCVQ